jgi:hypothetical protein
MQPDSIPSLLSPPRDRNLHALERLESRLALDAASGDAPLTATTTAVIVGNDWGARSTPLVRVLDPVTGAVRVQFMAYEQSFRGGVRVSTGDVTGDGIEEIITGPGAGRLGEIRVFTQAGVELPAYRTRPFGNAFTGGVEVAAGAVTGPGKVAIVAAQGARGNLVRVFTVTPGAVDPVANVHARQFQPFGPRFIGGVRLATADLGTFTGNVLESEIRDGVFEIVASSGAGIRATVAVQNAAAATPTRIAAFNPLAASFNGGVFVARLPGTGDAADRVIVSGGQSSGSQVETWWYAPTTTAGRAFVRAAAFAAFPHSRAAVVAAALDESNIFTAQNVGGTTRGVRRNTAPTGGTQTTLPSSIGIIAPQRITVMRSPQIAGVVTLTTDFNAGADGWVADAADLPSNPDVDYELDWGLRPLPAEVGAGNGFMLQGKNRSDDLFLYMTRQLNAADGILPNTSYQLAFEITLASNAPSGLMGVGGSPAESVFLKAGGSSSEPKKVVDQYNNVRLNVDKGNQGQGGNAATVAGNIANGLTPGEGWVPTPYASIVRQVTHTANVSSDRQGRLWLLAGIDSGFEGFTRIYLQKIEVRLTKA